MVLLSCSAPSPVCKAIQFIHSILIHLSSILCTILWKFSIITFSPQHNTKLFHRFFDADDDSYSNIVSVWGFKSSANTLFSWVEAKDCWCLKNIFHSSSCLYSGEWARGRDHLVDREGERKKLTTEKPPKIIQNKFTFNADFSLHFCLVEMNNKIEKLNALNKERRKKWLRKISEKHIFIFIESEKIFIWS